MTPKTSARATGVPSVSGVHPLWMLLTAVSGVTDQWERARLTATALPSLFNCELSGAGLLEEDGVWNLVLYRNDAQLPVADIERILRKLEPIFQKAFKSPPVFVLPDDSEPMTTLAGELGVDHLFLAPMMTVRRRLGMLIAGTTGRQALSREEESALSTLAEHSAIGIENLRLHQALQQYSEELQHRTELILDAAGEGIYGLDAEGRTTFVNPAAAKMLGWQPAELIAKPMHDLHHHSRPGGSAYPREQCPIYAAFKDGEVHRVDDEVFWRKDGSSFPVEYTSTPIREHGQLVGAVVVFRDITERKRAEAALRKAHAEVKSLTERLKAENLYLQEEIRTEHNFEEIIGQSAALQQVLQKVAQVAPTEATVLIQGETGTGKELIARAVHNLSPRKDRPLVKVNCGAISAGLVESELFGHEKGAFTGALQKRVGRFELADGGTLFLDEVGELPPDTQVKLLRALQEQEFERVGSSQSMQVNVRIIVATNRDLAVEVEAGKFRSDLFYRLNVFPIEVPPLGDRRPDIPLLVAHLLAKLSKKLGKPLHGVTAGTMDYLMNYPWPGNIRELENIIERAAIVTTGPILKVEESLPLESSAPARSTGTETLEEVERAHILAVLDKTDWVVSGKRGAAAVLGINPSTLRSRMEKLGIRRPGLGG